MPDGVDVAFPGRAEAEVGRPDHVLALGVRAQRRQEKESSIFSNYLAGREERGGRAGGWGGNAAEGENSEK